VRPAGNSAELSRQQQRVLELLAAYRCLDDTDAEALRRFERFVCRQPNCLLRSSLAGHLTASAAVVDPRRRRLLLVHHKKLGRWLQPGGHADGDPDLLAVALRETWEETGVREVQALLPAPFDLDIHPIPERRGVPEHLHYDVRFLLGADSTAPTRANPEVHAVAWVALREIETLDPDASLQRLVGKIRAWAARR
jgi:8-oxo-dGTP pyrophosphatase MutT (NUDIX family)